jgi:tRNA A-37 threonylcarbamoyl transferase component Bud32
VTIDYEDFGTCLLSAHSRSRTIYGESGGQRIWIKQTVPPKARIWHTLQKLLAASLNRPFLRATVSEGGSKSLAMEAARLREFKAKGFHVPDVLGVYDNILVMTDAGPQLRAFLDQTLESEKRAFILKKAVQALAALHNAGLAHGRPYMRDMTWDGRHIGFLDLEEDPVLVMPIMSAQARDVWIFLSAASRYARLPGNKSDYDDALIADLFTEYKQCVDPAILDELRTMVEFAAPLRQFLDRKFLWSRIGTDARQSVFVNRCLESCLKDGSSSSKTEVL